MKDATIIITVYNRTSFLAQAIDSVVSQNNVDRDDVEIIVVTNSWISKSDYPVDRIIFSEDRSVGQKLHEGIRQATSDRIFFLEDDDLFLPAKLKSIIPLLDDMDVGYVHNLYVTGKEYRKQELEPQSFRIRKLTPQWLDNQSFYSFSKRFWDYSGNMSSIAIRKDAIDLNELSKIKLLPDIFILPMALLHERTCLQVDSTLTFVRVNENSTTHRLFDPELHRMAAEEIDSWVDYVSGKSVNLERQAHAILAKRRIAGGLHNISFRDILLLFQYETATRMLFGDIVSYIRNRSIFGDVQRI